MSTPYMYLTLPTVGPLGTPGPYWANELNTAIDLIDSHDHTTGKGKTITPSGLNINQTFQMNSNRISEIASLALDDLTAQPSDASLIYEYGGELWFNDGSSNLVQLTSGGTINVASLGTITGDYSTSTADLTYSDIAKTFIFKQSPTVTAEIDCGPVKIYRNVAGSYYSLLQNSASQTGDLDWTLPVAYPASTLPIVSTSAGVLSTSQVLTAMIADLNVTTIKLADLNVTTAKIADLNVTTGKIADQAVTAAKIASAVAGSGLTGGAGSALAVNVDNYTIEVSSDIVQLKDNGIVNAKISTAAAIARYKIAPGDSTGSGFSASGVVNGSVNIGTSWTTIASGTSPALPSTYIDLWLSLEQNSTSNAAYIQSMSYTTFDWRLVFNNVPYCAFKVSSNAKIFDFSIFNRRLVIGGTAGNTYAWQIQAQQTQVGGDTLVFSSSVFRLRYF